MEFFRIPIFPRKFPKIIIQIWIQQFYFGKNQKYLWKCFCTVKKPLKNRAIVLGVYSDLPQPNLQLKTIHPQNKEAENVKDTKDMGYDVMK